MQREQAYCREGSGGSVAISVIASGKSVLRTVIDSMGETGLRDDHSEPLGERGSNDSLSKTYTLPRAEGSRAPSMTF